MNTSKITWLGGAGVASLAMALQLAAPSPGAAQTRQAQRPAETAAAESTVEEVVITGVRASVGNALEIKRTATQLQESIVAEDIGKLPDNNVVEALQHVSGISILRNNVEPGTVLIRGLPDIATTLSGRQIFTSAGRFISLPDLPAELLSRVDVKKSASADDLEGGIAGLIDVRLHRPFDFREPTLAGGYKTTYGTLSEKYFPTASILGSDRWDTGVGEVGALLDVSYTKRQVSQDQIAIAQRTLRRSGVANAGTGPAVGLPAGTVAVPNSVTLTQRDTQIARSAINASLQWRPNDAIELFADYFFSQLRNEAPVDVNGMLLGTCPNSAGTKPFEGTNIGQVMPFGCYGLSSMQARHTDEDTYQLAFGGKWYVTDSLTLDGELDYTKSSDSVIAFIPDAQYNFLPGALTTVTLNPFGDGGTVVNQPGDPQLSPNAYINQWYDQRTVRDGDEWAFRVNGEYRFADNALIRSVEGGVRWNKRSAVSDQASTGLNCALTSGDGANAYNKYRLAALNSPACLAYRSALTATSVGGLSYAQLGPDAYHTTKGSFFDGKYGNTSWVNLDQKWVWDNAEKMRAYFGYSGPQDFVPTNHFDVTEESTAAFVKVNYGFEVFSLPIDGNIGLRAVRTKLTESGFTQKYVPKDSSLSSTQGVNSTCLTCLVYTPTTGEKTDTQYLPSFNLRATLMEGLYLRAGASKTVTRPTFAQLNPGTTLNAPTATLLGTASGGDPNLSPVFSKNYDLDLTYYWGHGNHIGGAAFYRQVEGYIQTAQSNLVVEGVNYILSRPANFQDADISGFEVGYSQFLDFLPGFWSGFGWDINATFIDAPFNNVAKRHVNASGIYEKGPWSFRVSYTYNSPYLIGAFSSGVQPQFTYARVRENADLSLNYRFSDRLTLSFDATNLGDDYQVEHAGEGDTNFLLFPTSIARFDKTYSVGLRFKM